MRQVLWCDLTEELMYQDAVEANPRRGDEGAMAYIQRLAEYVAGQKLSPAKPIPAARLPYKDQDEVLMELRRQADAITAAK